MDPHQNQTFFYPFLPLHYPLITFYPPQLLQSPQLPIYGWKNNSSPSEVIHSQIENQFGAPIRQALVKQQETEKPTGSFESSGGNREMRRSSCVRRKRKSDPSVEVTENRNILPNITSNVLSFVRRINRSGQVVSRIIERLTKSDQKSKYTVKKFYAYQFYLKENLTDYKGKDGIEVLIGFSDDKCACFSQNEQQFYNKVCRVLMWRYLNQEIFSDILSSNRLSPRNRKDYLKVKRYLESILRGTRKAVDI